MSYYDEPREKEFFESLAKTLKDQYIVGYCIPSEGQKYISYSTHVFTCSYAEEFNSKNGKIRFIISDKPPQVPPSGAFGAVYPQGVKCDGTWIPVDFRPVAAGDWGITRERSVYQWENSWPNVNRIIVQKIESPAATKENVKMEKTNKLEKSDLRNFRFEIGADEIYPPEVIVPKGYEVYDFCSPSEGEKFLSIHTGDITRADWCWGPHKPRLLVRPVAKIDWNKELEKSGSTPRGWRPVGFRLPSKGEWFCWNGEASQAFIDFRSDRHLILERAPLEFTFDGVTFEAPIGYEFVRVGFLTKAERGMGWRWMDMYNNVVRGNLMDSLSTFPRAIFRPVSN